MDKHVVILQREIIVRGRNAEIRNKKMQKKMHFFYFS